MTDLTLDALHPEVVLRYDLVRVCHRGGIAEDHVHTDPLAIRMSTERDVAHAFTHIYHEMFVGKRHKEDREEEVPYNGKVLATLDYNHTERISDLPGHRSLQALVIWAALVTLAIHLLPGWLAMVLSSATIGIALHVLMSSVRAIHRVRGTVSALVPYEGITHTLVAQEWYIDPFVIEAGAYDPALGEPRCSEYKRAYVRPTPVTLP